MGYLSVATDGDLMDDMDEIIQEFLIESSENLDQLDQDLLALEMEPNSRERLSSAFRTIHTIKGTSGFLAFHRLEKVTHTGESLLSKLRDGELTMTTPAADALLHMVDTVREILSSIEATGNEGDVEIDGVMQQLRSQLDVQTAADSSDVSDSPPVLEHSGADVAVDTVAATADEQTHAANGDDDDDVALHAEDHADDRFDDHIAELAATPTVSREAASSDGLATPAPDLSQAAVPSTPQQSSPARSTSSSKRAATESSLRVDVDLLDALMRLAGELVLTRNQLMRGVGEMGDPALTRTSQRLNVITTDLQESIMKTRMQPVNHLWAKLPRVVRDLGAQMGRQIRLEMRGKETELDRALLEAIKDPLTHLVRNSVDHGIEDPDVRAAAGKPREGVLSLRAYHNSGQVVIEVADDGAGIDPGKVADKAIERGLKTAADIELMSDAEILQLIFSAGFSTAAAVTNVSGRGVGMDVVKTNLEAIGGAIELESVVGEGTTCRMRVPLTLAIVPALTVECSGARYAIAQASLLELVALDTSSEQVPIEYVGGAPVYRLRGSLLPLISLSAILSGDESGGLVADDASQVIVVLQAGAKRFGLLVDRVRNTEEIVVNALSPRLKNIGVYSGATILGDGTVALILDIQNLARRALRADAAERAAEANARRVSEERSDSERLLIAGVGDGSNIAIPMSMVTRLEMIAASEVESVGHREAVQYRGQIIPLVRLDHYLGVMSERTLSELPVAVYTRGERSIAIVMDEIIDIVEYEVDRRSGVDDRGFVGSVVVRNQIVGLLDVEQVITTADPDFFLDTRFNGAVPTFDAEEAVATAHEFMGVGV